MIKKLYDDVKVGYNNKKFNSYKYKIYKLIVNFFFPIIHLNWKKNGIDDNSEIIVSLTSFPERINTVWMTIVSLMNQTKKPKKILLWLSKEQFTNRKLPSRLENLIEYGLDIRWCDDLKPHKKYYYTMQEYYNKCIVIADDDIFYPENHLEILWVNYLKHPECIIANKTHRIEYDSEEKFLKYNNWSNCIRENPSFLLVPIGCNGVLYPPGILPNMVFNKNYILDNVLYTDDLWLKVCALNSKIKTYSCRINELVYFDVIKASKVSLWKSNTLGINRNDIVWEKLMNDYSSINDLLKIEWKKEL